MNKNKFTSFIEAVCLYACFLLLFSYTGCSKTQEPKTEEPPEIIEYEKMVTLFTEKVDFGHSFIVVGDTSDMVLYTYGRYGKTDSTIVWNGQAVSPTGEGILVRITDEIALEYIKVKMKETHAKAFEIKSTDPDLIVGYFDQLFYGSDHIPTTGFYTGDVRARVIDAYHILNRNCTTILSDALVYSGAPYKAYKPGTSKPIVRPEVLEKDLLNHAYYPGIYVKQVTGLFNSYINGL